MIVIGVYTVNKQYNVIYIQQQTFQYLLNQLKHKKLFFITADNRMFEVKQQQLAYYIPQQNSQPFLLVPITIQPFLQYSNRVIIEEYTDRIVFRDISPINFYNYLSYLESASRPLSIPRFGEEEIIQVKIPRKFRKEEF